MPGVRYPWKILALSLALLLACLLCYIALGSTGMSLSTLLHELRLGDNGLTAENVILWRLRMPRALAATFVGVTLATVGTAFQALFRNPLAEPYVIGVSSGAAVGGTLSILIGIEAGFGRMGLAAAGALLSLLLVVSLAKRRGAVDVQTLIVAGVVVGALLSGWTTLNLVLAGKDSAKVLFWLLGSVVPMYWPWVAVLAAMALASFAFLLPQGRALNALAVDEFIAERMGVDVRRLKWTVLIVGSLVIGVTVGVVGVVGFVGLVAPHISRKLVGNDVRRALPLAAVIGSLLVLAADLGAQRLRPGMELPLGAVTAVLGAPFLLSLLRRGN
ncbi:MAG: iron ABC transporter permease [Armatimonadetes bacterium]|nr:iron ABC transporter permease [Armatimonadota bacterium]